MKKDGLTLDDSYWTTDTLLPGGTNQKKHQKSSFEKKDKQAPKAPSASLKQEEWLFPPMENQKEKIVHYNHPFIFDISLYSWPNHYTFFSNFKKNAESIFHLKAESAPPTPFFSFMPQFHQLTASQLRFYLYFRYSFQNGKPIPADFSYILLYIYEIINLPELISPKQGALILAKLWLSYKETYPKLHKYLSEWFPDYCMIHNVYPERELFQKIAPYGLQYSTFPEFFMEKDQEKTCPILQNSSYYYKDSKYRTPENSDVFDKYMVGALNDFTEKMQLLQDHRFHFETTKKEILKRTSYDGAVCVFSEKKQMEICYLPFKKSNYQNVMGDVVRYAENHIRRMLHIRARLSTPSLNRQMKGILDAYFQKALPFGDSRRTLNTAFRIPDYENKYEPENEGFSTEKAKKIENESVDVALMLGAVFEKEEPKVLQLPTSDMQKDRIKEGLFVLMEKGERAFREYSKKEGLLPSTLASFINEEALRQYNDIAISEENNTFSIITDYEEEIKLWIKS